MQHAHSLEEVRALLTRPASLASVVVGRVDPDPLASCLGRVSAIARDEVWPTFEGRPMAGLAQLSLAEAPFIPPALQGLAWISVFWEEEDDGFLTIPDRRPNGDGWLVRAYGSTSELVEVEGVQLSGIRPRRLTWERVDDLPDWESIGLEDGRAVEALLAGERYYDTIGGARQGTKLGGWPDLIQSEIEWGVPGSTDVTFCVQIDSEEKVGLGLWDSGVIHIGLAVEGDQRVWVAESQFM